MDEKIQALAVETAHQLLRSFRLSHPWWTDDRTPLDEIASWLGLEIATFSPDEYPQGTYGFLEPGENLVWLHRNLSSTLRRFTLAHELGHAILHRQVGHQHISFLSSQPEQVFDQGMSSEDPCQVQDVREEVTGLMYQEQAEELLGSVTGLTYNPRSQRELAANIFAAELLMPLERLRELYLTGDVHTDQLAIIFDVSNAALLNRLAGLLKDSDPGIITPPGQNASNVYSPGPRAGVVAPPKKHYDEFQQAAIEAPTPALIVAGPGSGKTSTLIGRVEYLIDTLDIAPENILALTFSRKAAEEMRERLHDALDEQTGFPMVSTFHAFCAEVLRTFGNLVGLRQDFAFVDDAEGYFLLLRLADELPLRHYQNFFNPTFNFPAILNGISRAKDELVTAGRYRKLALHMLAQASSDEETELAEKALEVAGIYALYQAALVGQGDTDFGGLIMLAVQLLQEHPGVRQELQQKYQHILVDEFQDINRASGVLLRELAGDTRRVWVVGDANQAIYGFRGASPANITNFHQDYSGAVVLPLSRNYRSRPDIVSFADAFRSTQLEPDGVQYTVQTARLTSTDAYVTLAVASDETSELNGLISDMRRKQSEGYNFRDIVVLCRTRTQARKISQALVKANLPVIERGGILEQEHIKNLLSIVMLLADPSGMGILRASRQPDHALVQSDIEALLQDAWEQKVTPIMLILSNKVPITMSRDGCRSLSRLSDILGSLNLAPNVWTLLADYLFIETSLVRDLLVSAENPQVRAILGDYTGILQLARNYDQQQQTLRFQQEREALERGENFSPVAPPGIQEQARGFLNYLTVLLTLRHDGGNRHENTKDDEEEIPDVIRVMTVHASKGLEFPVVYLPGIVKQRFPIQRRSKPVEPPAGMLPPESEGDAAHETGEACLFYVGATRARDHLVLSYAERYGKKNYKHSTYIEALLAGLPENRIRRVFWQNDLDDGVGHVGEPAVADSSLVDSRAGASPAVVDSSLVDSRAEASPAVVDSSLVDSRAGASPAPTFQVGNADPARIVPPGVAHTWFDPVSSQPSNRFIEAMQPKTLSIQTLEMYQRCPRRYMYNTIYGFRGEKSAYGAFLRATHETLEALKQKLEENKSIEDWDGQFLTEEETRDLYTQHWLEQDGHAFPFAALYERHGHEVTELIRRKLLASRDTNWQLSQNFTVDIAGKSVEVAVDRIEMPAQDGEPMKFVRTRFGKRKEKPAATSREMLYARASRQHHAGRNIELHLHNMSTGETYPIKLTDKKEQALYNELEQAILGLERNEFPPKPDAFVCPTCPFFLICPA